MLVTLQVWRVPVRHLGGALLRMARDPRRLRAIPGVRFAKMLGTGRGRTFGPGDADFTRYAALVVWEGEPGEVSGGWERIARSSARIVMEPLVSRGRWSGREPFGAPAGTARTDGPVLALTRARLRPARALTFWRCVPPVVTELDASPGLIARFGIGEAPIGWQGTVTVWRSTTDLTAFAYRQPEHRRVIARTPTDGWYAEELFSRFAVRDVRGDRAALGWVERDGGQAKR
jgi:hypothetical protein